MDREPEGNKQPSLLPTQPQPADHQPDYVSDLAALLPIEYSVHPASPAQTDQPKSVPDQATIDALLQITKMEHERRMQGDGRKMRHWWNPLEWANSTPAMRKDAAIKMAISIGLTIILTIVTDRLFAHSGIKL